MNETGFLWCRSNVNDSEQKWIVALQFLLTRVLYDDMDFPFWPTLSFIFGNEYISIQQYATLISKFWWEWNFFAEIMGQELAMLMEHVENPMAVEILGSILSKFDVKSGSQRSIGGGNLLSPNSPVSPVRKQSFPKVTDRFETRAHTTTLSDTDYANFRRLDTMMNDHKMVTFPIHFSNIFVRMSLQWKEELTTS